MNATSSGTPEQIRYLVELNVIPPLCDLLSIMDTKVIEVALNGLENILKLGQQDAKLHGTTNPYVIKIEECGGLDRIETLQGHQNEKIYNKTFRIIENYFGHEEEDQNLMPQVDTQNQQFAFNVPNANFAQFGVQPNQQNQNSTEFNF